MDLARGSARGAPPDCVFSLLGGDASLRAHGDGVLERVAARSATNLLIRCFGENLPMHVTAKADYAVRAVVELAAASRDAPRKVDEVAQAQDIPVSFLENILTQLRSAGIVRSKRGLDGGYWLAQPADKLPLATVIRAVEGPLVGVRGQRPEEVSYGGSAESLQQVWLALRANLRKVLEHVTVADVASGKLPKQVVALTRQEEAWKTR
jgi:Rrf2 family protein